MIWRTAKDNRVRDSHRAMNGQRVSYGSSFTSGNGVSIRFRATRALGKRDNQLPVLL